MSHIPRVLPLVSFSLLVVLLLSCGSRRIQIGRKIATEGLQTEGENKKGEGALLDLTPTADGGIFPVPSAFPIPTIGIIEIVKHLPVFLGIGIPDTSITLNKLNTAATDGFISVSVRLAKAGAYLSVYSGMNETDVLARKEETARCIRSGNMAGNDLQCSMIPIRKRESYYVHAESVERVWHSEFRPFITNLAGGVFQQADLSFPIGTSFVVPESGILTTASRIVSGGYSVIYCHLDPQLALSSSIPSRRCLTSGETTGNDVGCTAFVQRGETCITSTAGMQRAYFVKLTPFNIGIHSSPSAPNAHYALDVVYKADRPLFLGLAARVNSGGYSILSAGPDRDEVSNDTAQVCVASGEVSGNDVSCEYFVRPGEYFKFRTVYQQSLWYLQSIAL